MIDIQSILSKIDLKLANDICACHIKSGWNKHSRRAAITSSKFGVLDPVDKVHAKGWYIVSILRKLEFHLFYSPHVPSLSPGLFR